MTRFLANEVTVRREFFGGLLFNQRTGHIHTLNQQAVTVIEAIVNDLDPVSAVKKLHPEKPLNELSKDINAFLHEMKTQGMIKEGGQGRFISLDWNTNGDCLVAPRSVFWEATGLCNIASCIHCYSGGSQQSSDSVDAFDFIRKLVQAGVFTIDIGGGEPLIRKNLSDIIMAANNKGMRCNIATNLAMNGRIVEALAESVSQFNNIQISLDGPPKIHEKIRGKDGVFAAMEHNLGILRRKRIPYDFNCTVMTINSSVLEDVVRTAVRLGGRSLRLVRLIPSGRGAECGLVLGKDGYKKMCMEMQELSLKYKDSIRVKLDESFLFLEQPKDQVLSSKPRIPWLKAPKVGCGAARTLMSVTSTGDVYPCAYLRDSRFLAGNIRKKGVVELWRKAKSFSELRNQTELSGACDSCDYKHHCLGGCRAAAYGTSGSLTAPDPECWNK